ncbi:MAG: hypothetical protein A3J84_01855 [Ignavibacteria bacterium RIFOXYA2_FULL_37_17]|nr:MAG: hypothetical protein A3J84_01855 [Ignavibacteria bacterium RIFOXYA2_FULL_37_17]
MKKEFLSLITLLIIVLFTFRINAQSETPELVTDRPDQTESALVVPTDFIQMEMGFIYQQQKYSEGAINVENNNLILGSTLFRYGINMIFELRFGGEYFSGQNFLNDTKSTVQGVQNILAGTKIQLRTGGKILTNAAVIMQTIIPFGNEKLRPNRFEPEIRLCLEQEINDRISLGVNLGTEEVSDVGKYFYSYTAAVGVALTERLDSFFEVYGTMRNGFIPSNNFDCGLTYVHTKNIQIDFSIGTTLNNDISDWFGGLGISVRLPR